MIAVATLSTSFWPSLDVTLSGLAVVISVIALVRTIEKRPHTQPSTPAPTLAWLQLVAALPEEERIPFLEYARTMSGDFDHLGQEHVTALYETYRVWQRPDLPLLKDLQRH